VGLVELGGQAGQAGLGRERGVGVIRGAHLPPDRGAHLLRQVVLHVVDLVKP